MRFALIGNHPDGAAMARALIETGKHELTAVCAADPPDFAPAARRELDFEELLADPEIGLVIVASPLGRRGEDLRRAAQSERAVMCVHPCDARPDLAYEVSLIADESKRRIIPLMSMALHPVFARLLELLEPGPRFQLIEWHIATLEDGGDSRAGCRRPRDAALSWSRSRMAGRIVRPR